MNKWLTRFVLAAAEGEIRTQRSRRPRNLHHRRGRIIKRRDSPAFELPNKEE